MTSPLIVCPACGSETPRGEGSCVSCGELLSGPEVAASGSEFAPLPLDGHLEGSRRLPVMSEAEANWSDDPEASYEPLVLQPDDHATRDGRKPLFVVAITALVTAAGVWAVAEWRIATTEDWGVWEPIWYVAAIATIVLAVLVGVLLWRTRFGRR